MSYFVEDFNMEAWPNVSEGCFLLLCDGISAFIYAANVVMLLSR
jgi:hypothetical protein